LRDDGFLFLHTPNAPLQLLKARLKRLALGMRPGVHYLEAKDHLHLRPGDHARPAVRIRHVRSRISGPSDVAGATDRTGVGPRRRGTCGAALHADVGR
jgi:hypothetical protein